MAGSNRRLSRYNFSLVFGAQKDMQAVYGLTCSFLLRAGFSGHVWFIRS